MARAGVSSFATLLSASFLLILLVLAFSANPRSVLAEAVTRDQVASQSTDSKPRMSGIDAMEVEANALAETITNQIRAMDHASEAKPETEHSHLVLEVALCMGGLFVLIKVAFKFSESFSRRDPWTARATTKADLAAEEKSFSEFATEFTTKPLSAQAVGSASVDIETFEEPQPVPRHGPDYFLEQTEKRLAVVRRLFSEIGKVPGDAAQHRILSELRDEVRALRRDADFPSARPVWQMAAALDGLLQQLVERVHNATPSALRTMASAIDLLHGLRLRGLDPELASKPAVRLLVVDDDAISRHAMAFSLKKVFTPPDVASGGEAALALAEANAYDVIFLDIQMPRMDGFELCSRIHGTLPNATTPVVFVTCRSDFDARARSIALGGQDLLAKPFLTFELAVKALTLVLRRRLDGRAKAANAPSPMPSSPTPTTSETRTEPELAKSLEPGASPSSLPTPSKSEREPGPDAVKALEPVAAS